MERTISDEEKIKKAIEISQRRNNTYIVQNEEKVNLYGKKQYKLFKKMLIQIIICLLIYVNFYLISTTNYFFSEDVMSKTGLLLNYDMDWGEIYNTGLDKIKSLFNKEENQDNTIAESNIQKNENKENETQVKEAESKENKQPEKELTQEEKDISYIKSNYKFIKPLSGKITSEFGEREVLISGMTSDHKGIDISQKAGTKIKAAIDGQVIEATANSEYGNFIKIKNGELLTVYAHCKKIKVSKGDKIKKGDVIATVGSTGVSTGPHLHFEIRLSDRYINPRSIIEF